MDKQIKTRVAIAGLGGIARKVYLPLLSAHQGVDIVGVMNRSQEPVSSTMEQYRLPRGTTDMKEMLAWEPEAVFIHAATEAHFDLVMACIEKGIAVYVDKPLSYDVRQNLEMTAFAEAQAVLLAVGFNRRFAPHYVAAKAWLEEVGGFSQCAAIKHRTGYDRRPAAQTVYDDLIHMLDLLLWLGGDDYEQLHSSLNTTSEGYMDAAFGTLRLGDAAGTYSMSRQAGADIEKLELHGAGRSVEVTNMEQAVFMQKNNLSQTQTFGSWDTILERRGFTGVVNHFLEHIHRPEKCAIQAGKVLESHMLAEELISRLRN
ncbi:virulence factor [Paenibacillus jamilae]|uniref:Dehydrogenase n=1 Tax=Paenibacillus polymyxa TaxID=1406 RepID=A0A378Y046_PAEPO|nr:MULTISPECIES: Gfo/Idh/MocA family oxidoreductase [Paenibacillus]MDP9674752.1 virulence factor [Paenibacillus jamilae]KAE8558056.1 dehydrogenase [Paenibacillus polymyxa]KAF6620145.1 Gfo/Idh/MocA family oxidoreductase [Paenibacillus sp. EKM101P]KAF6623137.1 Gfo/Idh/MocA family oxidoreductase [Paenibacillus sp. EKM102P]KAF6634307.1 Gfo/Idh/MocA family oxidoreductase [Paenibacillus sp. EKM10P]